MIEPTPPSSPIPKPETEPSHGRLSHWKKWQGTPWLGSPWFFGLLIVLAVFLVYSNSLQGEWIYDDYSDILGAQSVQKLWPLSEHFFQINKGQIGVHPRPIVSLTFALNFHFGRNDPFLYHLTSLTIHALASLCLFALVRHTLRRMAATPWLPQNPSMFALFVGLLWGLHPLQTEAVAYITQRYESLMGFFVFLTLLCVNRSAESPRPSRWNVAAAISCLLALGSKEVAVSLPILVLLYDRAFLTGSFTKAWRTRRGLYLAFCGAWILFAWNQSHVTTRQFAGFELPWSWWQYAANQPMVILHYLRLVVWPHPLVLDYLWLPVSSLPLLIPGFLVIGALLMASVVALIRNSWLGFLGAFFFLILAPTSSIMPLLDLAVEHRMYLPLAPVVICLAASGHLVLAWVESKRAAWIPRLRIAALANGALMVALLGSLTFLRSDDYRNSLTIWLDTVIKRPINPRARANYAHALQRAGKIDEAIAQARLAVALAPNNLIIRGNLGSYLEEKGLHEEAIQELRIASRIDPSDPRPWVNLAIIYARMKDRDQALECVKHALALDPRSAQAHFEAGNQLSNQGSYQEALNHYTRAMQLQPGFSLSHWGAAEVFMKMGQVKEALEEYTRYVELDTRPVKARSVVGTSLLKHGKVAEAYDSWRLALEKDPRDVSTLLLWSWTLSTHPQADFRNGSEALSLAERALGIKGERLPAVLEVMGTAYAELGRFPEACAVTEEALAQLKATPKDDLSRIRARLEVFRRGEPYREDPTTSGQN